MKKLVTKKEILRNYKNVIEVSYCQIQGLMRTKEPKFYTTGIYGWNADIYEYDSMTAIVTGYRPFGNVKNNYDIAKKYEEKATEIIKNNTEYSQVDFELNKLIEQFVNDCINKEV